MSILAIIFLCLAVTFHVVMLGYLFRFFRWPAVAERHPSLGQFGGSMKGYAGPKDEQTATSRATRPTPDVSSVPPQWVPSGLSAQGGSQVLKMPHVFKVRIGDGKHPEDEKEFVGLADSSDQAVMCALSMASNCEVPLVFSVERISVLDL